MALTFLWLTLLAHAGLVSPQASPQQPQPPKAIFILAGQSNMSGRGGVINTTWDGLVPPECRPRASILRLSAELRWEEAAEPLHRDIDVYAVCGVGPGMAFANSVLQRDPSVGVLGLVPCAVGGTKISQWSRGGSLYNQLVRRAEAASQGGGAIQAVLWYQGESDTVNEEDARLYKSRLQQFFMDLRADLQSPLLPIIQVALASGQGRYVEEVREGQMGIDLANVWYVDGKGLELEADHVHLSTAAQVRLGQMLAHAFLQTQPTLVRLPASQAHPSKPLHIFLLPHLLKPFLIISLAQIIAYIVYEF